MASERYLRNENFQSHPYHYERDEVYYSAPNYSKYEDSMIPVIYTNNVKQIKVLQTLNYNDLENKPKLNNTTLEGEVDYDIMTIEDIDNLFK